MQPNLSKEQLSNKYLNKYSSSACVLPRKSGKQKQKEVGINSVNLVKNNKNSRPSKQKQKQKQTQPSFNEVVNKFKKLFDEKIKFVKNDSSVNTDRVRVDHLNGRIKKQRMLQQQSAIGQNKKAGYRKDFENLISSLEAKFKSAHSKKQHIENQQYTLYNQQNSKNTNYSIFQNSRLQNKLADKNKQLNKSNQKKLLHKPGIFSTLQQKQQKQKLQLVKQKQKSKPKSKSKNKYYCIQQRKHKYNLESSQTQNYELNLQQQPTDKKILKKQKLNTLQSQRTNQIKKVKKDKKVNKVKGSQNKSKKTLTVNKKDTHRHMQPSQKKQRSKSKLKQKSKKQNKRVVSVQSNRKMYQLSCPQAKKLESKYVKQFLTTRQIIQQQNIQNKHQNLFYENDHYRVSSSSSSNLQKSQSSQQDIQQQQLQNDGTYTNSNNKVMKSIIVHSIQDEDLFNYQIQSYKNQIDLSTPNGRNIIYSSLKPKEIQQEQTAKICSYLNGFNDYLQFKNKKALIYQFFDKNQNGQKHQLPASISKIQQALLKQQQKWLKFRNNLEKMKKSQKFNQELQDIIVQAQQNHLALKHLTLQQPLNIESKFNSAKQRPKLNQQLNIIKHKQDQIQEFSRDEEEQSNEHNTVWNTTIKSPMKQYNQINQININISLVDGKMKILPSSAIAQISNSLHKNEYSVDKKSQIQIQLKQHVEKNELQISDGAHLRDINKDIVENNKLKHEQLLSQSQLSLRAFVQQCQKHLNQQMKISQENVNQKIKKMQNNLPNSQQKMKYQKQKNSNQPKQRYVTKLSYEQAPLQINNKRQKNNKNKTRLRLDQDRLDIFDLNFNLNHIIANKQMNTSNQVSENGSLRRMKIFEELRSPNNINYGQNVIQTVLKKRPDQIGEHLGKNSTSSSKHQQMFRLQKRSELSFKKNHPIKISLFSQKNDHKKYSSEGNLLNSSSNELSFIKQDKNSNFLLLKTKRQKNENTNKLQISQIKKTEFDQQLSNKKISKKCSQANTEQKKQLKFDEIKLKKQSNDQNLIHQKFVDIKRQYFLDGKTHLQKIGFAPQVSPMHQYNIQSKSHAFQKTAQKQQLLQQQDSIKFIKSEKKINSFQISQYNIIEQLVLQFFVQQLVSQFETSHKFTILKKYFFKYFNDANINIIQQAKDQKQYSEDDLGASPFSQIKNFQNGDQYSQQLYIQPAVENNQNQPIYELIKLEAPSNTTRIDTDYIMLLASQLFNFIYIDDERYSDFMQKIQKPLGINTMKLLKILRENDIGEQQSNQLQNDLQNCFDKQQQLFQGSLESYYIISLDTLVKFQMQMPIGQTNPNQQFFNQAVYDKINLILDGLRPYGNHGLPVMNFAHKSPGSVGYQTYNRAKLQFDCIKNYVLNELADSLTIKLGLFNYDIQSDRIIQRSLWKLIRQYAIQLDDEWKQFSEGQFQIKYGIMLAMQMTILEQEASTIRQIMRKKQSL